MAFNSYSNTPARVVPYLISSRALSKAFEHRNFVARYQREKKYNHITVAKVACLVTMDASYNIGRNIHIHN